MNEDRPAAAIQRARGERCRVSAWHRAGVLLEQHAGEPAHLVPHCHISYQIGIATREPTEYICRGRSWHAPCGSVVIFPCGEVHAVVGTAPRRAGDLSRIMYIEPSRMLEAARAVFGPDSGLPRFDDLIVRDADFIRKFIAVHDACTADALDADAHRTVQHLLMNLVRDFSSRDWSRQCAYNERQRSMVLRASDFIVSHYCENISPAQLADAAHSSPFHLNRIFARHIGLPPHAFQNQIRVDRSKAMLLAGTPIAEIAALTGFFDQSHFTRHFHRIVGVPPSRYAPLPGPQQP